MERINKTLKSQTPDSEIYKEVELTQAEIDAALMEARRVKAAEIKRIEYAKNLNKKKEFPHITARQLFRNYLKAGFVVDDYNRDIIRALCFFFTKDRRSILNFDKGILLYGPVGCGKTSIMNFFRHNQKGSFAVFTTRDISYDYQKNGSIAIQRYKGVIASSDENKTFGQKEIGVCFDDLGTEVDKKFFGDESNVMCEIIQGRYDRHSSILGQTHITTNLNPEEIEERYGSRVRSRLRQMVNVLEFRTECPDRRK